MRQQNKTKKVFFGAIGGWKSDKSDPITLQDCEILHTYGTGMLKNSAGLNSLRYLNKFAVPQFVKVHVKYITPIGQPLYTFINLLLTR